MVQLPWGAAIRAAAFEPRVRRVIAYDIMTNGLEFVEMVDWILRGVSIKYVLSSVRFGTRSDRRPTLCSGSPFLLSLPPIESFVADKTIAVNVILVSVAAIWGSLYQTSKIVGGKPERTVVRGNLLIA